VQRTVVTTATGILAALNGLSSGVQTVASLLAVILAVWGIRIAGQAARDQRDNRNFGPEKAAADDFELALSKLSPEAFLEVGVAPNMTTGFTALGEAQTRFSSAIRDPTIGGYFTSRGVQVIYVARDWSEGRLSFEEARVTIASALTGIRLAVHNWPYPERRRDVLVEVYEWMIQNHYDQSVVMKNRHLQIARWMQTSYPSPSRTRQRVRGAMLWLRVVLYDIRAGQLGARISEWRTARKEDVAARAKWGKPAKTRQSTLRWW